MGNSIGEYKPCQCKPDFDKIQFACKEVCKDLRITATTLRGLPKMYKEPVVSASKKKKGEI
jgi:hypothetical protein